MPPSHCYKNRLGGTDTAAAKLGRRCPKFHAKQKGPQIPHLNLASLLCSYPYTTHKFTIFQPHLQRHFTAVLQDGRPAGGDGRLVGYLVRHLSVSGAGCFTTKVSVFGTMRVCEMPLLVGLEDCELVSRIRVGAKEGDEVNVRDWGLFLFSLEFGASATQFG